jgi:hypothetical protein
MAEGIRRLGDKPRLIDGDYAGVVDADVAVFYGFQPNVRRVMRDYVLANKHAIHIDLGYWSRRFRGSRYGYHRFSINSHHPTDYFQRVKHPQDRADALGITLETWKHGGSHILLCGMSEKAAGVVGFTYQQWERDAVVKIQKATERPIWYRPKAVKGHNYPRINGTQLNEPCAIFDSKGYPISDISRALSNAWCVVSHHSNAGIDAVISGVPCFQVDGVALPMGLADFSKIETPKEPTIDERRQWVNDVAYTQFNCEEMRAGVPWRHFKDEGLIG